jgi:hypothetical protein
VKNLKPGSWRVQKISQNSDCDGTLGYFQTGFDLDFEMKRIYLIHNVPAQTIRGNHAHRELKQVVIALGGFLKIELESAFEQETIILRPYSEVLIMTGVVWRRIFFESLTTICLVGASDVFLETDYIRDYKEFQAISEEMRIANPIL